MLGSAHRSLVTLPVDAALDGPHSAVCEELPGCLSGVILGAIQLEDGLLSEVRVILRELCDQALHEEHKGIGVGVDLAKRHPCVTL